MNNNSTMLQLCRLCLVKDNVNIPIFEGQGDISQIFQKISSCLPVKVTREDKLPQKICDGCSYKLDIVNDFRNTTVNAEKQLLTWLSDATSGSAAAAVAVTRQVETDVAQQIKPAETFVKQEAIDPSDVSKEEDDVKSYMFQDKFELPAESKTSENEDEPPPKRAKRTAAVKAAIALDNDSDEDDDDSGEPLTKVEDESDEGSDEDHSFVDIPSTSADDQPGPSGVNKDGGEAPKPTPKKRPTGERKRAPYNYDRQWRCVKCNEIFPTKRTLVAHRKEVHPKKDYDEHTYKFDSVQDFFVCNTCSAECQYEEEIQKHVKKHEEVYDCPVCHEKFKRAYDFGTHNYIHDEEKMFRCPLCTYKSQRRTGLLVHINYVHLSKYVYVCQTCGKGFNDVVLYKEHNNEHLGIKPFSCVVCGKCFTFSRYLVTHQIRSHRVGIEGQLLPNQCMVCHKVFSKLTTLEKHFKDRHIKNPLPHVKKHLCDTCGKGFAQKNKLRIHLRVHTGFKPYTCSYCPKSFTKKDYLVMHERVHSGEKPYSCEYCGKCFSQGAPLRIHLRTHTGERPYICNFCGSGFTSRGALNMHCKNCTGR